MELQPLTIFAKNFILDVWLGSEYAIENSYKSSTRLLFTEEKSANTEDHKLSKAV